MMAATKYRVLIAAGPMAEYTICQGWDELHDTRESAEAQASRAERHSGWRTKVVEVDYDRDETVGERMARELAEFRKSVRSEATA